MEGNAKAVLFFSIVGFGCIYTLAMAHFVYDGYVYKPLLSANTWKVIETFRDFENNSVYIVEPNKRGVAYGFAMCSILGRNIFISEEVFKSNYTRFYKENEYPEWYFTYWHEYYHMNYCSPVQTDADDYANKHFWINPELR